jgi:pyruvate dehydrogenase E2 component (dihydrolipoamide acetyltransferase)
MDMKLPSLGEGADSGTVTKILVQKGDTIAKDDEIIEMENEKSVAPIPSTAAGTVEEIYVSEGDELSVGDPILSVTEGEPEKDGEADAAEGEEDAGETKDSEKAEKKKNKKAKKDKKGKKKNKDKSEKAEKPKKSKKPDREEKKTARKAKQSAAESAEDEVDEGKAASPTVRKLARQLGIKLSKIPAGGRGGRISFEDLREYIGRLQEQAEDRAEPADGAAEPAEIELPDYSQFGEIEREELSSMRKAISANLRESWRVIPHVTQFDEADVTDLMAATEELSGAYEEKDARLTLTGVLIRALVPVLREREHRIFNASLDAEAGEIVHKKFMNIGIAVDTEHGLLVPVLRGADEKSPLEIARGLQELAEKAREGKLSADDTAGGSFTISNQGGIGGGHFTPIVNAPESAILGVGRAAERVVLKDGQAVSRMSLPVSVSYDHRLIDGAAAARFVKALVKKLESMKKEDLEP